MAKKRISRYTEGVTFLDILLNMTCLFIFLFIMTLMHMNDEKKEDKNAEAKAEYLITVTWPKGCVADIDSYLQDPYENVVFFQTREKGLMHLDRDDLGNRNDTYTLPDGTKVEYEENREVITIRGIVPGEYICNVHAYSMHGNKDPVEVTVKIEKMNPKVKVVFIKKVTLEQVGHEITVTRFLLDEKGDIVEFNDLEKEFTQATRRNTLRRNEEEYREEYGEESP